ncbi:hypothetical protein G6F22_017645 [Rhizopus arrhizus]|nr:hypothetical protein G6F22_017645 [Rhizopus arrhizus]KAG1241712.1 hypothetical protein G6F65_023385 [Rhizopus arrhizus]
MARGALRGRTQQAVGAGRPRLAHRIQALRLPFAFHHARQPIRQQSQPVADEQARQRSQSDEGAQWDVEDVTNAAHAPVRWARWPGSIAAQMAGNRTAQLRPCRNLCIKC